MNRQSIPTATRQNPNWAYTDTYQPTRTRSGNEVHAAAGRTPACRSGNFRTATYAVSAKVTCERCAAVVPDVVEELNGQLN